MLHRLGLLLALPIAAFAFTGCSQFVTGGGWIEGQEEGTKATFGFVFNNPDMTLPGLFQGTYHDSAAGVKVKFDGSLPNLNPFATTIVVNWIQQGKPMCGPDDAKVACTGTGVLYAEDNGEPGALDDGDFLSIKLFDFPGIGTYHNSGFLQGGNIQDHYLDG